MSDRLIRIFISSPGDVGQERVLAERVVDRLRGEFIGRAELEPFMWEHEPLRATSTFQSQIAPPSEADIVVCILWTRLGTRLPEDFVREDGSRYDSGTEWEFEDAARSFRERGSPDLLVYRKTREAVASLEDRNLLLERMQQKDALDRFIDRWFGSADASFKAAFLNFATADEFEGLLETHLRKLVENRIPAHLTAMDDAPIDVSWHQGSPFRGLDAFDVRHAPVFFGRTRAIGEIKEILALRAAKKVPFLLVFGMSGCGKSSLVRAGVLPTITQPGVVEGIGLWRSCVFRPSDAAGDLFTGLARALTSSGALPELIAAGVDADQLAELFRVAPKQAVLPIGIGIKRAAEDISRIEQLENPPETRLALVIDQLEELFTLDAVDAEQRAKFVDVLAALARSGNVWVICTMRSDYYHRCADLPELIELSTGDGQYHLIPPAPAEIAQIIRNPARAAGLRFELRSRSGERLDDILHAAAARDPAALPLLQFTLDELFKLRTDAGVLTIDAYDLLGGLEGALAQRAEEEFGRLPPNVQSELPGLLRTLVTISGTDDEPAAACRVRVDSVATTAERAALLDAFVDARLLVTDQAGDGTAVVRIAHEALLEHWPRVKKWLEDDREFLQTRARVSAAAGRWDEENRSADFLLAEGKPLTEAEDILTRRRDDLDDQAIAFVEASVSAVRAREAAQEAEARRKLVRTRLVAVVLACLATISAISGYLGYIGQQEANVARDSAEFERNTALEAQSLFLTDLSLQQTAAHDATTGILLALEALPDDLANPDRPYVPQAEAALYWAVNNHRESLVLGSAEDPVSYAAFSPDGQLIVTGYESGRVVLSPSDGREEPVVLGGHEGPVLAAAFSPDGSLLITASQDGTARVWNAIDGDQRHVFAGHTKAVEIAAIGPNGVLAVTGSRDSTARVWELSTGSAIATLAPHQNWVTDVGFSPDGRFVVTASRDAKARIWEASTGTVLALLAGHDDPLSGARFSADGRYVVTISEDGTARLWSSPGGAEIAVLAEQEDWVLDAAFDPDSERVATALDDGTVRLWAVAERKVVGVLSGHTGAVVRIVFSADGKWLATAADDLTVRLWNAATAEQLAVFAGHKDRIGHLSFSPDGSSILTVSRDGTARVWAARPDKSLAVLRGHQGWVTRGAFSPDSKTVLTSSTDHTARLWNSADGHEIAVLAGHEDHILHSEFSPDGSLVVTASIDGTARIWDPRTGDQRAVLAGHQDWVHHATFSPDSRFIVTASSDGTARIWDATTGDSLAVLAGHRGVVNFAAFSPNGDLVITTSVEGTARIWDRKSGRERAVLDHDRASVLYAAFSPDGARVVTATEDGKAVIWETATGKRLGVLAGHERFVSHVEFSPDGSRIVTASGDATARLWDAETGEQLAVLSGHQSTLYGATFSPDGRLVVTSAIDAMARLWDVGTGKELAEFADHTSQVYDASFSPDGERIVTASNDGTARIWRVLPTGQALIDYARSVAPRRLTDAERDQFFLRAK
ncbi:MAG: AAA family ATPase [Alphaproteobacteria bacterium]|nr:AAA family ATPase [Alphaproteobacteria bacterium]